MDIAATKLELIEQLVSVMGQADLESERHVCQVGGACNS